MIRFHREIFHSRMSNFNLNNKVKLLKYGEYPRQLQLQSQKWLKSQYKIRNSTDFQIEI